MVYYDIRGGNVIGIHLITTARMMYTFVFDMYPHVQKTNITVIAVNVDAVDL